MKVAARTSFLLTLALMVSPGFGAPEGLVDPTRPTTATGHSVASHACGVCVEAIITRRDGSFAVVNGRVVRAGDRFSDISIEEVTPDGVKYLQAGHRGFARLHQEKLDPRVRRLHDKQS
ncbi:MAG TPA: hypothetical protein VI653_11135 [Steroidobacteraceae bacterium]